LALDDGKWLIHASAALPPRMKPGTY